MRHAALALTAAIAITPGSAWACSVCFSATEENRQAFFDSTVLLTFVPLLLIGGGAYWVYRQMTPA